MKRQTSNRLNPDQARVMFEECAQLLAALKPAEASLRVRAYDPGLGYPNGSLGGSGANTGAVSDPVGNLVANGGTVDPIKVAQADVWRALIDVRERLTKAWNGYAKTVRSSDDMIELRDVDDVWCTSCARAKVLSPRGSEKEVGRHSRLCGWCHAWSREHGMLPPPEILERRARGERITSKVINEVLRAAHDRHVAKRQNRKVS